MNKTNILKLLNNSINEGRQEAFAEHLDTMLTNYSDIKACESLAKIIADQYTRYRADYLAIFLEIIIRRKPSLATLNHPLNDIFTVVLFSGAVDLYDCYIEEAIQPYLVNLNADEQMIFYKELSKVAAELNESFLNEYNECVKGREYNGPFGMDETSENAVLINKEDYDVIDKAVAKYNMIIGRRNILKDLLKRAGMKLKNL